MFIPNMMFAMTMFITIIFINVIVLPRYSNGFALRRYFFTSLLFEVAVCQNLILGT